MAVPATTAISTPEGIKLCDGFASIVMFARDPDISLWEKTVTPPMFDGGDEIDTTDMHNTLYRTEWRDMLWKHPNVYGDITNVLNFNSSITIHFPDLSTLDFYGFLRVFEPQELADGTQPEANCTIVATNFDPDNSVEQGPVMTEVAGT